MIAISFVYFPFSILMIIMLVVHVRHDHFAGKLQFTCLLNSSVHSNRFILNIVEGHCIAGMATYYCLLPHSDFLLYTSRTRAYFVIISLIVREWYCFIYAYHISNLRPVSG